MSANDPDRSPPPACTVGVVVAAYQAEAFVGHTVASLFAQTTPAWRCVIVDDGSSDATGDVAVAAAGGDRRIDIVRQANAGVGAARNVGVRALPDVVDVVCFLDSDDLLLPDTLATFAATLAARPDAVGCSGWAESIDAGGHPVRPGHHRDAQRTRRAYRGLRTRILDPDEDSTFESLAVNGAIWPPATAAVRRSAFDEVGGFAEDLPSQEDWDLFLRLARLGPLAFVDRQLAWYRLHGANATGNNVEYLRCLGLVRTRAWSDPANTPSQRRLVRRTHLRYHAWMAKRQLELLPCEIRERRAAACGAGLAWTVYGLTQLARPPRPPDGHVLDLLVRREQRARETGATTAFL